MGRPRKRPISPKSTIGSDDRVNVIVLKGSPEYAAWLSGIHAKTHLPKATIVRLALATWARENGHGMPPEA